MIQGKEHTALQDSRISGQPFYLYTSHPFSYEYQQLGHMEMGPWFIVSSKRPERRRMDIATPEMVVQGVIHFTCAAPLLAMNIFQNLLIVGARNKD